ncbi:MAG TPA: hypothetical protein VHY08_03695 [Bacillota bacterium]|nr:hypothetical protein [Bacillota bacterium]
MTSMKQLNQKPSLWGIIGLGVLVLAVGITLFVKNSKTGAKGSPVANSSISTAPATTPKPLTLFVEGVMMKSRSSRSNKEKSGKDELIATVQGRFDLKDQKLETLGVMAFWRLPSASANWYLATKQENGKIQPAVMDGVTAAAGNWNFEIGGIEVDKTYQGPIIIVLMVFKTDLIAANQKAWLEQNKGDGFVEIPQLEAKVDSSAPATFTASIPVH